MNAPDLFFELLPANFDTDEEARALAWGMLCDKLSTLCYTHSESEHAEILAMLAAPKMPDFVADASLYLQDAPIDFDEFAAGVRYQARKAREAGLVVPDGKPRLRFDAMREACGDLFAHDESEVLA